MNRPLEIAAIYGCIFFVTSAAPASVVAVRQLYRITPPQARYNFGSAVATDGYTIVVGAPYGGPVDLFDASTGEHLAQLLRPGNANPSFGDTVSVEGTKVVVGSWGQAFVYDIADLNNIVGTELKPDTTSLRSQFGIRVDISGNTIIVGDNADSEVGDFAGTAYLFKADTGTQITKLVADDTQAGDNFGIDVAISGHRALVGASGARDEAGNRIGEAYLFDAHHDAVGDRVIARYTAQPPTLSYSFFGSSLDIAGDEILITEANGSAFQWKIGEVPTRIPTSEGFRGGGDRAALTERFSVVGNLDGSLNGRFAALYDNVLNEVVTQIKTIDPFNDAIGDSVAIARNIIVMGASVGRSVYVFQIIPEPSSLTIALTGLVVYCFEMRRRKHPGCHLKRFRKPMN